MRFLREERQGWPMLERVAAFIERHRLLPEEGEVVVGISGGADSLCLLHLLRRLCGPDQRHAGVRLRAVHVNHMLRGEESERDAREVARMVATWGLPLEIGAVDVPTLARTERRSLEDAARQARYAFLRTVARGGPIAVAHHADDQVETLLLHWLRGSGLSGMPGMAPRQGDIIRPLLEVTHAETLAYCAAEGITPLEDQSNSDQRFLRNRLRHEVLPLLRQINPGLQATLLRNAEVARVDLEWLEAQVAEHWPGVVSAESEIEVRLMVQPLLALPLSLQRHLLRRATARLCAGQSPLESRHLILLSEQLARSLESLRARELHLPQHLRAQIQAGELLLSKGPREAVAPEGALSAEPVALELPAPGQRELPGTPWLTRAELLPAELEAEVVSALSRNDLAGVWRILEPPTPHMVYLDAEQAGASLLVRTRWPGDRIQPLGMNGEKKVQDLFIDGHLSRAVRATTPLFFAAHTQRCLWVAGITLDHQARLTSRTRRILRLSITPRDL